jgi:hypothetical protein
MLNDPKIFAHAVSIAIIGAMLGFCLFAVSSANPVALFGP